FAVDAGAALVTSPTDREEWQDCVLELGDDFSDLEELQVLCVQGADRSDRAVIRIVGKFFPEVYEVYRLLQTGLFLTDSLKTAFITPILVLLLHHYAIRFEECRSYLYAHDPKMSPRPDRSECGGVYG
ncbi:hypothetical protein ZWY2020_020786, partial [Hordeum vulgare]